MEMRQKGRKGTGKRKYRVLSLFRFVSVLFLTSFQNCLCQGSIFPLYSQKLFKKVLLPFFSRERWLFVRALRCSMFVLIYAFEDESLSLLKDMQIRA